MSLSRRSLVGSSLALAWAAALPRAASAADQPWPSRPVRLIVPYAAGGPSDIVARAIQPPLQAALGQSVVVENRAGGGSMIGGEAAAHAPDGHTFLVADSPHTIIPAVQTRVPYDPVRDFVPVGNTGGVTMLLATSLKSGFTSLDDFVNASKANPEKLTFGSSGVGSLTHLLPEWMTQIAGGRFTIVPYRGAAPALQDVISGNVDGIFTSMLAASGPLAEKMVRPLAVASAQRLPGLPDVPTFRERGIDLVCSNWYGILAPKSVPKEGVSRMESALNVALDDAAVKERMASLSIEARPRGAAAFGSLLSTEFANWGRVAREAKIEVI